jgi:hypothetical protein
MEHSTNTFSDKQLSKRSRSEYGDDRAHAVVVTTLRGSCSEHSLCLANNQAVLVGDHHRRAEQSVCVALSVSNVITGCP